MLHDEIDAVISDIFGDGKEGFLAKMKLDIIAIKTFDGEPSQDSIVWSLSTKGANTFV